MKRRIVTGRSGSAGTEDSADARPDEKLKDTVVVKTVVAAQADRAQSPPNEDTNPSADVEPAVDRARLGEHVASVLEAVEVAAERIRKEAQGEAELVRERAQEQAAARLGDANRKAGQILSEVDKVRSEAEEAAKVTRERADAYAEERRRAAEAEASKLLETAEQVVKHREQEEEERQRALRENIELTEKRLDQLVMGLRELALQLEELVVADRAPAGSDERTPDVAETLDESLKASITAEESTRA